MKSVNSTAMKALNPSRNATLDLVHQNLRELNDEHEVIETVIRAARSADRGDWTGCRACFTKDIFLDCDGWIHSPLQRNSDEVIEEWKTIYKNYSSCLHFVSSFEVDIEEGTATCNSLVQAVNIGSTSVNAGHVHQSFGCYSDTLIVDDDMWKISKRIYRQNAKVELLTAETNHNKGLHA